MKNRNIRGGSMLLLLTCLLLVSLVPVYAYTYDYDTYAQAVAGAKEMVADKVESFYVSFEVATKDEAYAVDYSDFMDDVCGGDWTTQIDELYGDEFVVSYSYKSSYYVKVSFTHIEYADDSHINPKPEETKPVETKPVETEPVETKPVETEPSEKPDPEEEAIDAFSSMEAACERIREALENKETGFVICFWADKVPEIKDINGKELLEIACAYTGHPKQGDYLRHSFGFTGTTWHYSVGKRVVYEFTYKDILYATTLEQEKALDKQVDKLLGQLNLWNASDYQKVKGIYTWMCENITYAYNQDQTPNMDKPHAYHALVERQTICNGYSMLFYRLANELGVECRYDCGTTSVGDHAWNVVKLDGLWYYVDATWDAVAWTSKGSFDWFLKGSKNFVNHYSERDEEFAQMNISAVDYQQGANSNPPASGNPFKDVKTKDYFYNSVIWAYSKEITTGVDATHFKPNDRCTRGQVVTFLWRACGSPEPASDRNPFKDVSAKDYYYKPVLWAVENGITTGTDATHFSPGQYCTRGHVVTFLWRVNGKPAAEGSGSFRDVKKDAYYFDAVAWAVQEEITSGMTKTEFAPEDTCTRGQTVTFLYRTFA